MTVPETAGAGFSVRHGLASLGEGATRLVSLLDEVFTQWALDAGAEQRTLPALLPVADAAALGVYENFPHLAMVTAALRTDDGVAELRQPERIAPAQLQAAQLALPSATCYGVYLGLRDQEVADGTLVTSVNTCYRNESHFDGLRRLRAFRMREVVALGSPEHVQHHIERFTGLVRDFASRIGLELELQDATDPFFDPDGVQAMWQKMVPVKKEFVHGGQLAIASVNNHRTFFGERCGIGIEGGDAGVSSGCAAFGLERWVAALTETYDGDWQAIVQAVEKAGPTRRRKTPPASPLTTREKETAPVTPKAEQQMIDEIEKWLRSQNDGITALDQDTDLVETGLITSLKLVELTFLLGRLTGRKIDLEGLKLEQFRTLRSITENFLRYRENAQ